MPSLPCTIESTPSSRYGIECIFNCATADLDCGLCLYNGVNKCARQYCPKKLRRARGCLFKCAQAAQAGGDLNGCLESRCPKKRDALESCIRPHVEADHCDRYVRDCETSL
jgi:hypothetical protein